MASYNKDLYKQIILEHYDFPDNKVDSLEDKTEYKSYHNKSESCIDDFEFFIKMDNNIIVDIKFIGVGCAISTSSTDILCNNILKKSLSEAQIIINEYKKMIDNIEYDNIYPYPVKSNKDVCKSKPRTECCGVPERVT